MPDRLLQGTFAQKRVTNASMSIRVVGLYLKSFLKVSHCFLNPPLGKKNVSAVVIRFCIIGLQLNRLFEVDHRLIGLPFSRQNVCEIHFYERGTKFVMRIQLSRSDFQRGLIMRHSLVQFTTVDAEVA